MTKRQSHNDYIQSNLVAWQEVAPIHARHNQTKLLELFQKPGFSCLDETATNYLKRLDVEGKDVAQVCCNNGIELLSIKGLGAARCVGFDGVQQFLDQGQALAKAAEADVEFVCCEAHAIPKDYWSGFDLVVITVGVLSWMPDIAKFFGEIEKLLKPGGAVFVYEQHPIVVMVEPGGADDPVIWELSYFFKDPYIDANGLDYYGGETYDATPTASFTHKMSDILMAGITNGLRLEVFEELPNHISNAWWNVESSGIGLPMSFALVFRK